DHLAHGHAQRLRQTLAAVLDVMGQARPATFNVLLIGFLEAARRLHVRLAQGAAFRIAVTVYSRPHLPTDLGPYRQDGIDHILGRVFAARQALVMRLVAKQFVTYEADIAQGGLVIGHSVNLSGGFFVQVADEPTSDWILVTPLRSHNGSNRRLKHTFRP